jgi:Spy/CpxP family protein refolding chaperone
MAPRNRSRQRYRRKEEVDMRMAAMMMATATAVMLSGAAAEAQHGTHGPHGHSAGASTPGHQVAQTCQAEFDGVVATGRGFGMAFAADQNGYPGPMHALELKDLLKLTTAQEEKLQALMAAMFAESRPKSTALLAAEDRLRKLFAGGAASEADVRAAALDVERARTDVRLVHLLTHLKTREILSDEQRRLYHAARWSGTR